MIHHKIKAIVFDVDGVLFHNRDENGRYLPIQNAKEALGLSSVHFSHIYGSDTDVLKGKKTKKEHLSHLFSTQPSFEGLGIRVNDYIGFWLTHDHHVNQDILELVKSLKIPCYLGTNQEALPTASILDTVGSYFKECFASYKIGFIKPEQGFFYHIEKALALLPHELLLIDDKKNNTLGTQDCGWRVYHYQNDFEGLMAFLKKHEVT